MEAGQVVAQAIHSIWEEWSQRSQAFQSERPEMQRVFQECLGKRLPEGWSARGESRLSLRSPEYSAWSQYDIGILRGDRLIALLELSLGDTNIPHALHNGELKLLGNCGGIGRTSGRPYSVERGLTSEDIAEVAGQLQSIPVRGLFFVGFSPVLERPDKAMWWETKGKGFRGETRFWSALLAPEKQVTLREVFQRLAEAGLHCWFYSLCGEERLEHLPPPSSGATGGGVRGG